MSRLVLKSTTLTGNSGDLNLFLVLAPEKYYWDLIFKSSDDVQATSLI